MKMLLEKTVRLDGENDYMVTGIADAPPDNSQISYEALISFSTLYKDPAKYAMDWNGGQSIHHLPEIE